MILSHPGPLKQISNLCHVNWGLELHWLHRTDYLYLLPALMRIKGGDYIKPQPVPTQAPFSEWWLLRLFQGIILLALLMTVKPRKTVHSPCISQTYKSPPKRDVTRRGQWGTLSQGFVAFCFIQSQSSFEPVKHLPYQVLWLSASIKFSIRCILLLNWWLLLPVGTDSTSTRKKTKTKRDCRVWESDKLYILLIFVFNILSFFFLRKKKSFCSVSG